MKARITILLVALATLCCSAAIAQEQQKTAAEQRKCELAEREKIYGGTDNEFRKVLF